MACLLLAYRSVLARLFLVHVQLVHLLLPQIVFGSSLADPPPPVGSSLIGAPHVGSHPMGCPRPVGSPPIDPPPIGSRVRSPSIGSPRFCSSPVSWSCWIASCWLASYSPRLLLAHLLWVHLLSAHLPIDLPVIGAFAVSRLCLVWVT